MQSHELGRRSEAIACDFLRRNGWQILEQNYRAGHKELDIVARKAQTIAFIEVKARTHGGGAHGFEAINWKKRRELTFAARTWIRFNAQPGFEYRFDAIAITWRGSSHTLEHIENAWMIR